MALNFPNSPTVGQVYTDTDAGFSYEWDGTVWKSYSAASSSQIKVLDDISGSFNGTQDTFALSSNSSSLTPLNSASLIINLGGVVQDPSDDYSVSGSNIVFSTPPSGGLSFSGVSLGPAIPVNSIPDGTTTSGSLSVASALTASSLSVSGIATASSFVGDLSGNATGLTGTPNLDVGIVTATELNVTTISGGAILGIQSGGQSVGAGATTLNFIGTGNTFSYNAGTKTLDISIQGGGGGGSGVSTVGVTTGYIWSNPNSIDEAITLNQPDHNYAMFGPVALNATVTVGAGNTFAIV